MKTLRFAHAGKFIVLVHNREPPAQAEWDAYIAALTVSRRTLSVLNLLVVTEGGAPNAAQRAQIATAYGDTPTLTAVCNRSAIVQRVITAVGWITRARLRGFDYDDLAGAMDYLAIAPTEHRKIAELVAALQTDLGARRVRA
jgi:hypothetical protein